MKRSLLFLAIVFSTLKGNSQTVTNPMMMSLEDYNSWDVGAHMGLTFPQTDISGSGLGFGIGADVTKFLSHSFALQARLMHATLHGEDITKPEYTYNTTINYDFTVNALAQIGNISFMKRIPNLAFYGTIGFGFLHYSPQVSLNGGATYLPGIYSQYAETYDTMDYQGRSDVVVPFGIGVKYRVKENLSLTAEYNFRTTNTDKLDGFFKLLSADDSYSYFSMGVCFHLGSQRKTLEWENPLETLYNDLYQMKAKVDRSVKDSDGDGVADLYDKDPSTPPGGKVYGDGTSVDSDSDGVPDVNDAEPFSTKNARVDASGKEIVAEKPKVEVYTPPVVTQPAATVNEKKENIPVEEKKTKEEKQEVKKEEVLPEFVEGNVMPSIYFGFDNSSIDKKYYSALGKIALYIKDHPQEKYRIVGICDGKAGVQYNMNLAKKRAESVKKHLVKNYNIDQARLKTEAVGKTGDPQRNPQNRRVDIKPE